MKMERPCNTHFVKIAPRWYEDVIAGRKRFEIRRNDRHYALYDLLVLCEWYHGSFTGRYTIQRIEYIYYGDGTYGLSDEWCILGIRKAGAEIKNIEEKIKEIGNDNT